MQSPQRVRRRRTPAAERGMRAAERAVASPAPEAVTDHAASPGPITAGSGVAQVFDPAPRFAAPNVETNR